MNLAAAFRRLLVLSTIATVALASIPSSVRAAADPKTIAKCQAVILKGGAKFLAKKVGAFAKCTDGIFKCIQTIDETADGGAAKRSDCITKARAKCGVALAGVSAARQAFTAGTAQACGALDATQVTASEGLGYAGSDCTSLGGAPVTDVATLTTCLAKQHDCLASRIHQLQAPRVLELMQFTPPAALAPPDADTFACLDDAGGGTGADVDDPALGKALVKCQKAVEKIGAKLTGGRLKVTAKCIGALFVCAQTKTGDDLVACRNKARTGCAKAFDKNAAQSDDLGAAAGEACSAGDLFAAFLSPAGGNLQALLPSALVAPQARAVSIGCSPLVTIADYRLCIIRLIGLADGLVEAEAPRTESLLTEVGCTLEGCSGTGPQPDSPGIYPIVGPAGNGTHPLDRTRAVAIDDDGTAYVTGFASDNVLKVTPGGAISQILDATGDGQGHGCDAPGSLALGPNDTVYVGCRDYVFKLAAGTVTPILGPTGDGTPGGDLRLAAALVVTSDETVYVAGALSDNAFKITKTGTITVLIRAAGDGLGNELSFPEGIAVDTQGNVFVASQINGRIFKITAGGAISVIPSSGSPFKLATFGDTLYWSNFTNVQKRTPDGTITVVIDATGDGQGHELKNTTGVALDAAGNLYVAGSQSDNAFKVTPGGTKTQIIGPDGDGAGHVLDGPQGIAVNAAGRVVLGGSDSDNAFRIILP